MNAVLVPALEHLLRQILSPHSPPFPHFTSLSSLLLPFLTSPRVVASPGAISEGPPLTGAPTEPDPDAEAGEGEQGEGGGEGKEDAGKEDEGKEGNAKKRKKKRKKSDASGKSS